MTSHILKSLVILGAAFVTASFGSSTAMTARQSAAGPLAPFQRLIGRWHLEGSVQEFRWGVGRTSVIVRGYFLIDGELSVVSEGMWFWHPGEERIKGIVTAMNMPVVLFDYSSRFEDDRMVSELTSYDAAGQASSYIETFEFMDNTQYKWTLFSETNDALIPVMGGTYTRQ